MTDLTFKGFFGDADYEFRLKPELIEELERTTGAGIGLLSKRLLAREFKQRDIIETVRLGLIGAGMTPQRASELVEAYVPNTPLLEVWHIAVSVITARMVGTTEETTNDA